VLVRLFGNILLCWLSEDVLKIVINNFIVDLIAQESQFKEKMITMYESLGVIGSEKQHWAFIGRRHGS
jgi:hypothetical protein